MYEHDDEQKRRWHPGHVINPLVEEACDSQPPQVQYRPQGQAKLSCVIQSGHVAVPTRDQQRALQQRRPFFSLSRLLSIQAVARQDKGRAECNRVILIFGAESPVPTSETGRPIHHGSSAEQNQRAHMGHLPRRGKEPGRSKHEVQNFVL